MNKLHGEYIEYQDGSIWKSCNLVDSKIQGECIWYYPNGSIWKKYNYVNDQLHGEYIRYNFDGSIKERCNVSMVSKPKN